MKKFASLLLTAVLLCTMLSAFAVPAFAEDAPKEFSPENFLPTTMFNKGSYIIKEAGEYEVETIFVCPSTKLIIGEGVTIKMTHALISKGGTIEVLGTLDVSQSAVTERENIIVGDTGELIDPRGPEDTKGQIAEGETKTVYQDPHKYCSILSEGNLTIIVGIAALAIGLGGGFFIGTKKKQKKPAAADGTDKTDEE